MTIFLDVLDPVLGLGFINSIITDQQVFVSLFALSSAVMLMSPWIPREGHLTN